MIYLESISGYFSNHNKMGKNLLKSLSEMYCSDLKVRKSGESKYSLFFRQEYIECYKTPNESYTLSINNRMYDVSNSISKKIWNLMKYCYDENRLQVDRLQDKFDPKVNEAEELSYDNSKLIVSEFNSKKGSIDSIFSQKNLTSSQIDSNILTKIYGNNKSKQNSLIDKYVSVLKIERDLIKIENESNSDNKRKSDIKKNIQDLKDKSVDYPESVDYYGNEISKAEDSLRSIEERISERSKNLSELKKKLEDSNSEFDELMDRYIQSSKISTS